MFHISHIFMFHISHNHCVKSARIWSYSGPALFWTEHFSVFSPNAGKYGPDQLRIQTLFMQWLIHNGKFTGSYKYPKIYVISPNMQKYRTGKNLIQACFYEVRAKYYQANIYLFNCEHISHLFLAFQLLTLNR